MFLLYMGTKEIIVNFKEYKPDEDPRFVDSSITCNKNVEGDKYVYTYTYKDCINKFEIEKYSGLIYNELYIGLYNVDNYSYSIDIYINSVTIMFNMIDSLKMQKKFSHIRCISDAFEKTSANFINALFIHNFTTDLTFGAFDVKNNNLYSASTKKFKFPKCISDIIYKDIGNKDINNKSVSVYWAEIYKIIKIWDGNIPKNYVKYFMHVFTDNILKEYNKFDENDMREIYDFVIDNAETKNYEIDKKNYLFVTINIDVHDKLWDSYRLFGVDGKVCNKQKLLIEREGNIIVDHSDIDDLVVIKLLYMITSDDPTNVIYIKKYSFDRNLYGFKFAIDYPYGDYYEEFRNLNQYLFEASKDKCIILSGDKYNRYKIFVEQKIDNYNLDEKEKLLLKRIALIWEGRVPKDFNDQFCGALKKIINKK